MVHATQEPPPRGAQPCVWTNSGLLASRLCPRDLDCDHCPLDAAIRGLAPASPRPTPARHDAPRHPGRVFPDDRRYAPGHTWLLELDADGALFRFGLDGFAAALLGVPQRVDHETEPDHAACRLLLREGPVRIAIPTHLSPTRWNVDLEREPGRLPADPYGEAWIAELSPSRIDHEQDRGKPSGLFCAEVAADRARLDLRRFLRRIALEMLDEATTLEQRRAPELQPGTDLRGLVDAGRFLDALRDIVF